MSEPFHYIIVHGRWKDGFEFYGPFSLYPVALELARSIWKEGEYEIAPLTEVSKKTWNRDD